MILDILPLAGGTARLVRVYGGEPCVKLPGAGSTVGVDAVSGSTMTSDAVFAAMNDCLAQAAQ